MGSAKAANRPQLVTALAAAKHLGVARETLRKWTATGYVPVVRDPLTGRVRYSLPALDAWLEANCPSQEAS